MAFNRKLILQRAADARAVAAVNAALTPKDEEEDDPLPSPAPVRKPTTRKDPLFRPKPTERLELWAPTSLFGIPVTLASGRVSNYASGTPCVCLTPPRSMWKGKEMMMDIRIDDGDGPTEGWIRAAHARWAPRQTG